MRNRKRSASRSVGDELGEGLEVCDACELIQLRHGTDSGFDRRARAKQQRRRQFTCQATLSQVQGQIVKRTGGHGAVLLRWNH